MVRAAAPRPALAPFARASERRELKRWTLAVDDMRSRRSGARDACFVED